MDAADYIAATDKIIKIAKRLCIFVKVAVVLGDDVLHSISGEEPAMETGKPLSQPGEILSANAYLGADAILPAPKSGADIIIKGGWLIHLLSLHRLFIDLGDNRMMQVRCAKQRW